MPSDEFAIEVEGLSKRYPLPRAAGQRRAADRIAAHLREYSSAARDDDQDYLWALKDISFNVAQGEVLGVVGRNGSGKSTLLKILSGVTQPTSGRAKLRGRVGSLLEVGTGFHPDMSGRENVFMAGALLGLSQEGIRKQFDEIVDFAELERFIDVPVKRYSSGMYIRLAFSVASLLHSDILILDEVLAVGDAAFKKKSERNIERISKDGRTVLIVSHSMESIRDMCQRALVLERGRLVAIEEARAAVTDYLHIAERRPDESVEEALARARVDVTTLPTRVDLAEVESPSWPRPQKALLAVETRDGDGATRSFKTGDALVIRIEYELPAPVAKPNYFTVFILNEDGARVFVMYNVHDYPGMDLPASGVIECRVDHLPLVEGEYIISLDYGGGSGIGADAFKYIDFIPEATRIKVRMDEYFKGPPLLKGQGVVAQKSKWRIVEAPARARSAETKKTVESGRA